MNEPGKVYLSIKQAARLFGKPLEALTPDELQRVNSVATRQQQIETLILETPQAAAVMLPEASIDASLMEIRNRYANDEEFHADLERVRLDASSLRQAVARDLVVEAVLDSVAAGTVTVSETDAEIFWHLHRNRFRRAETRLLRHILLTINEHLPGSERHAARERIAAIRSRLVKEPQRFAEQALKHSQCPTAINGGLLGKVPRGQLYPELEAVAFGLAAATLSETVESALGYHLIYCEAIHPERLLDFAEARQPIIEHLQGQQRSLCQKAWIQALRRQSLAAKAA